jgi:tetratricopeptide (TPR) repeat protein
LGKASEATNVFEEALAEFREFGSKRLIALTLDSRGMQRLAEGDLEGAGADLEEAIALASAAQYERGQLFFDVNLGEIEFALGHVSAAIALAERAMGRTYAMHEPATLSIGWSNLGMYYSVEDRWDDALRAAELALRYAREADLNVYRWFALQTMAAAGAARGDYARSAELLGFVDAQLAALGGERGTTEAAQYDRLVALLAANLGQSELEARRAAGASLTPEQAERLAQPSTVPGFGLAAAG